MSPKSLLRHKEAVSTLEDLAEGRFQHGDRRDRRDRVKKVSRVIVCSGKVYYDSWRTGARAKSDDVAIVRLEQQYPFPHDEFEAALKRW